MPTVPTYDQPQVKSEALPSARLNTNAPAEAFGGGESAQRASAAGSNLAGVVGDIAAEEKKKADQVAVMTAATHAAKAQTDIQVATSKMQGRDAFGAPDYASKEWKSSLDDIRGTLSNDDQRHAFDQETNSRGLELYKFTQLHVASQQKALDESETKSYLDTSRNAAVLNASDDSRVAFEVQQQTQKLTQAAERNGQLYDADGKPSETFKANLNAQLSSTYRDVIQARLNAGQDASAKSLYESLSAKKDGSFVFSHDDALAIQKHLETADTFQQGNELWGKVQGFTLADGNPDEARMQAAVMAAPGESLEKKEKIWTYVKARAGEAKANKAREDAADDRSFANEVIQARKSGAPLSEAMKIVGNYAQDDTDELIKNKTVQDMYAPPSKSNPTAFLNIWEKVQDGAATKQDVDALYTQNLINESDHRTLREQVFQSSTEGRDPSLKYTWESIRADAKAKVGDQIQRDELLGAFARKMQGKSPEEITEAWKKQVNEKTPGTGWLWNDPVWKGTVQQVEKDSSQWAPVYSTIGRDQAKAIGASLKKEGWTPADIQDFAAKLGGMKNIEVGTPANNAIRSLTRRGIPLTDNNIRKLLTEYPDGNY